MHEPFTQPAPRERILIESERLFRHNGYSNTTMADIAEACRMSPATLYRFFPSKSALIEAICGKVTRDSEARLRQIVAMDAPASRRLDLFIADCHRHTLDNLLDHRKVHEMVVVAMEEQWHAVKAHLDRVCLLMQTIIEDGIASGEFRQQDAARAARCVHSSMSFLCHPVIVAQKLDDESQPTPHEFAGFILNALKA
jgi:AcrR family transcriptional regulator